MSNATKLPTLSEMTYFQWSTVDAPNPALAASIAADDTTLTFTSAPLDENGVVVTEAFLMGIRNDDSYVENVYVPAGGLSVDGLTATGCVRGVRLTGIDWTTGDADLATAFDAGAAVFCNITAVVQNLMVAAMQGTIATGGANLIMGTDADGTVTIKRSTGAGTSVGWVRWNTTGDVAQFSNNGTDWVSFSDSAASVIFKVSAADTTPSYLSTKLVAGTNTTVAINNPAGNETYQVNAAGTLASVITDVSTTEAELDQALDGIGATVTAANLTTLTASASSNADALHTHSTFGSESFTAYEAVSIRDALALMPIEVEFYAQQTPVALNIGNTDGTRGYGIKIIPSVTTSTLTTMQFLGAEAVNGATNGNLDISIQTDSAGSPSGTIITNGSANQITQATLRTWNTTLAARTATWAASPTLTAGTTYWIVFKMDFTDVANYVKIGENSSYDENYLTFTRQTFNAATGTWGGAVTNATPFFWFTDQSLGQAVVPCDADWPGRAWRYIGHAYAAASAQGSVSTITGGVVSGFSGLTPGRKYYLSGTPGAITATAPAIAVGSTGATYGIGRAISTSKILIEKGPKTMIRSQTFSSSTTAEVITWFRTKRVDVYCAGTATSAQSSVGYSDGEGTNTCTYATGNASTNGGIDTDSSWHTEAGAGATNQGTVGTSTSIGFTLTNTKAGGGSDANLLLIITGN